MGEKFLTDYTVSDGSGSDTLIELRRESGMSRKEFCEYFGIPYRTVQDWELGNRKIPEYLLRLMIYKVKMEEKLKDKEED